MQIFECDENKVLRCENVKRKGCLSNCNMERTNGVGSLSTKNQKYPKMKLLEMNSFDKNDP